MDRELRLAAFQTWVEEQILESKVNYLEIPDGNLEEEIWNSTRWNTLSEVREKLKEALGE